MRCSQCCRHSGFVRLIERDVDLLASHLGLSVQEFAGHHTSLSPDRAFLTLNERDDGSCVFLEGPGDCTVYAARPLQCRDFPVRWNTPGFRHFCRASANITTSKEVSACP